MTKPNRTRQALSEYVTVDDNKYNHVAMDGGRYLISREQTCRVLPDLLAKKILYVSLVPVIDEACVFFADIDSVSFRCSFQDIKDVIHNTLSSKYNNVGTPLVTKNQSAEKYHVYYPKLIVSTMNLRSIWREINSKLPESHVDESCTALRYDGFAKFSKKSNRYQIESRYERTDGGELDLEFFNAVYLPRTLDVCTPFRPQRRKTGNNSTTESSTTSIIISGSTSVTNENSQDVAESEPMAHDHDLSLHHEEFSDDEDEDILPHGNENNEEKECEQEQTENEKILEDYPFLEEALEGHTVTKRLVYGEGVIECFALSKSDQDRTCPFTERKHHQNNVYFQFNTETETLKVKCHSAKCKKKEMVVYPESERFMESSMNDSSVLDECPTTDDDLASLFHERYPEWIFSMQASDPKGKNKEAGAFLQFNPVTGIWRIDKGQHRLTTTLSKTFRKEVTELIAAKVNKCTDPAIQKQLMSLKQCLNRKLGDSKGLSGVKTMLQSHLISDEVLDANRDTITLQNGVYDVIAMEFRAGRKEDYHTTQYQTNFEYEERDERKIRKFETEYLFKVFPEAATRKTHLMYDSTAIDGHLCKKFMVQLGSGNNAKSNYSDLMKYTFGTYSYKANNDLLFGVAEQASVVNFDRKRFIYFEEPDATKKWNSATLKEWTGGSEIAARRHYSHHTATLLQAVFHINCNKVADFDDVGEAVSNRLIHFPMKSRFVSKMEDVDESKWIFKKDDYFKSDEFLQLYAPVFFHILLDHYAEYVKNGKVISMDANLVESRDAVLASSDGFSLWWNNNFEMSSSTDDFVTVADAAGAYRLSEHYKEISKGGRSSSARSMLRKELIARNIYHRCYEPRKMKNGIVHHSVLEGVKIKNSYGAADRDSEIEEARNNFYFQSQDKRPAPVAAQGICEPLSKRRKTS